MSENFVRSCHFVVYGKTEAKANDSQSSEIVHIVHKDTHLHSQAHSTVVLLLY